MGKEDRKEKIKSATFAKIETQKKEIEKPSYPKAQRNSSGMLL